MITVAEPVADLSDQRHHYVWDGLKLSVTLERFTEGKTGLKCEITFVDLSTQQKLLPASNFNLSSAQGRRQLTTRLRERIPDEPNLPIDLILDMVTDRSVERFRTGDQVLDLFSIPQSERPRFLLQPYIESDGVTLLYGDGGSMKSLLGLTMGLSVASGVPLLGMTPTRACPVLYLDWEASPADHAERARAIWAGADTTLDPPETLVMYQRQVASLSEGAPNAARVLSQMRAGLCIIDSVGMARGGAPEQADVTIQFFRAARSLGVPVLAIDHITHEARKSGDLSSPHGSRFTHNLSRRSWSVEKEQEEGTAEAALFVTNHKHNNGGRAEKMAYHIAFHTSGTGTRGEQLDRVVIQPQEYANIVADTGSLRRMTKKQQVTYALKAQGPMSVTDIRECLVEEGSAISEQVVRNTLNNNPQSFVPAPSGASGRAKLWCLQGLADDAT